VSNQCQAKDSISVIVTALNEEPSIASVVIGTLAQVRRRFDDYQLVLVDDGSTDRTGEIMDQMASENGHVEVVHNPTNLGWGMAYRAGLARARCEYVMVLCGDGGLPPESLPAIFEKVGTADSIVPYMENLREIKTLPRYLLSRAYTRTLNLLFGLDLRYYNGLAVHRRRHVQSLELRSTGFAFQAEILIKLIRGGAKYVEAGVLGGVGAPSAVALRPRNLANSARAILTLLSSARKVVSLPSD